MVGKHAHPTTWLSTALYERHLENQYQLATLATKEQVTSIGNDCWIGRNVVVMSGVTIGDGVVVGAGSVVTKDLEPYGIYAGVPAKLIKFRFDKALISDLMHSQWWIYDTEYLSSLPFDNVILALEKIKKSRDKAKIASYDKIFISKNRILVN